MAYPDYPQGGMPPPMPVSRQPASGGTAITAGVLAILGALFMALIAFVSFTIIDLIRQVWDQGGFDQREIGELEQYLPKWLDTFATATGAAYALASALLGIGAILLFTRTSVGRWMVVAGCVTAIALSVIGFFAGSVLAGDITEAARNRGEEVTSEVGFDAATYGSVTAFVILPALVTLILAALPATGRWIADRRQQPQAGPGGYEQPPPPQ